MQKQEQKQDLEIENVLKNLIQSRLKHVAQCVDLKLTMFSRPLFTQEDVDELENSLKFLEGESDTPADLDGHTVRYLRVERHRHVKMMSCPAAKTNPEVKELARGFVKEYDQYIEQITGTHGA